MAEQREDGRDEWMTPGAIYTEICDEWGVYPTIDLFASQENTKCEVWIDKEQDALKSDWMEVAKFYNVEPIGWLQPPYSSPILPAAVAKAVEEAKKGFTSLFLLPSWVDQDWYFDYISEKHSHKFWYDKTGKEKKPDLKTHRIKFIPPAGIKPSSPRYGNIHGVIKPPGWERRQLPDRPRLFGPDFSVAKELTWEDVI